MRIKQERRDHCDISYHLNFKRADCDSGWGFDCDENGVVDVDNMNPSALDNYLLCTVTKETHLGVAIVPCGVERYENNWRENAIGACDVCGGDVELGDFTCECEKCGALYNWGGQRLADRSQWGEETGEHPADIERPLSAQEEQLGVDY